MKAEWKFDKRAADWLERVRSSPWVALVEGLIWPEERVATVPIVPRASVAGRALTVVVAIMCFLACLTVGAVYLVHQSASAWISDIASEVTVQISPGGDTELDKSVTLVALFLAKQPGIQQVTPLSEKDSAELLEPWLGQSEALSALPVPRLIAVRIDRSSPPDMAALRQALESNFDGVTLDDHRRWQTELRTVTRSLALGGLTVLILVGAATVASIVSATRSAMASNREIIEVLHFVGARDTFIAHEFEKHFLAIGIRAGLVGAAASTVVFLVLPLVMRVLGGGTLAANEFRRLIGPAVLDFPGYLLFALVVLVVASLSMLTCRYGVYRILKSYE